MSTLSQRLKEAAKVLREVANDLEIRASEIEAEAFYAAASKLIDAWTKQVSDDAP